jgi:co-chaperonin GroES (HSP10)
MPKGKYQTLELTPTTFPPHPQNYKKLHRPLRDLVHVQLDRTPDVIETPHGPLVLAGGYKAKCQVCQALVLALGPEAKGDIEVGQTVLIAQHLGCDNQGSVRTDGTMLIQRKWVLAVVEA